jgi:hypothetical protein
MSILIQLLQGGIGLAIGVCGGAGAVALVAGAKLQDLRDQRDEARADLADAMASLRKHRNQLMFSGAGKLPAMPRLRRKPSPIWTDAALARLDSALSGGVQPEQVR